jgi:hypothetical protein
VEPSDPDPLPDRERWRAPRDLGTLAEAIDDPDDLVPGNDRRHDERKVALDDVEVGAAHTACDDSHAQLTRPRHWNRHLSRLQR